MSGPIYKANGKHVNCYYDEMFYETLGDNFQRNDSIVIVEITGENFEDFIDPETETEANKIFKNFSFKKIGYTNYSDWNDLSSIIGEDEVKNLRKIYFDCDDYKNVTCAVLLYYNFTFVTLLTD
tara:strand:+ start:58 stop:429 length:372 start_codon:yes stop_codon:yes gene_type:complete